MKPSQVTSLFVVGLVIAVSSMAVLLSSSETGIWPAYYVARTIVTGFFLMAASVWMMSRTKA
jgi:hypothetical protein